VDFNRNYPSSDDRHAASCSDCSPFPPSTKARPRRGLIPSVRRALSTSTLGSWLQPGRGLRLREAARAKRQSAERTRSQDGEFVVRPCDGDHPASDPSEPGVDSPLWASPGNFSGSRVLSWEMPRAQVASMPEYRMAPLWAPPEVSSIVAWRQPDAHIQISSFLVAPGSWMGAPLEIPFGSLQLGTRSASSRGTGKRLLPAPLRTGDQDLNGPPVGRPPGLRQRD